jgi:hypothetical protein
VAATGRPSAGEGSGLPEHDEVSQSARVLTEMSIHWVVAAGTDRLDQGDSLAPDIVGELGPRNVLHGNFQETITLSFPQVPFRGDKFNALMIPELVLSGSLYG